MWRNALLVPDSPLPEDGAERLIPIITRRLPDKDLGDAGAWLNGLLANPELADLIGPLELFKGERVILLSAAPDGLEGLLASGRFPEPGKPEVLAGDLVRPDSFELDGETFRVVGRLRRSVSGLGHSYVVLDDDALRPRFSPDKGATQGWLDPEGLTRILNQDPPYDAEDHPEVVGGATRTSRAIAAGTVFGLIFVALGGALIQITTLRWLWSRYRGPFPAMLGEVATRPWLLGLVHVLLYGAFFGTMLAAYEHPLANLSVGALVREEFTEGSLDYIGAAYASRDVLRAAGATFWHNYLVATISLTILPSILMPFAGVLKNLVTFATVGFAMSPIWTGSASQLAVHSITMALELEAYVVASFAVAVWPIRFVRGLVTGELSRELSQGLRVLAGGAAFVGVILAVAAFYEAATIILLRL